MTTKYVYRIFVAYTFKNKPQLDRKKNLKTHTSKTNTKNFRKQNPCALFLQKHTKSMNTKRNDNDQKSKITSIGSARILYIQNGDSQ